MSAVKSAKTTVKVRRKAALHNSFVRRTAILLTLLKIRYFPLLGLSRAGKLYFMSSHQHSMIMFVSRFVVVIRSRSLPQTIITPVHPFEGAK